MIKALKNLKLKFKIILDFSYSILASVITMGTIQLIIYPLLAKIFTASEYGQLLTVMGIVNTISSSLGITLNNTRLIQNTKYYEKDIKGDFNILLSVVNIIGFTITIFIGNMFFELNLLTNLLLSVLVILISSKSYLVVGYRLNLNFKLNLLSSIVSSIGYLIGALIVNYTLIWPLAFIIAEIFSIVFILFTLDLHKEPYKITKLFGESAIKYLLLVLTGLMGNLLVYLDRLIIYPILGGGFVSIYVTASFFGKSLGILMTPVAGVFLSYFSQKSFKMTLKRYWNINFIIFLFSIAFFLFSWIIAPWFTGLLYPTLIKEAKPYIFYANTAAIIGVAANMIQSAVLKFSPTYWQLVKEIVYGIIYIGLGFILLSKYGLFGFCAAAISANSIKLILLCSIGSVFIRRRQVIE